MDRALANLSAMEYPGRVIIIGRDKTGSRTAVIYAVTGRSPSSQARKLEWREDGVWVRPTDEEILKKGNPDLLIYPAMLFSTCGVAVSNGKQTADLRRRLDENAAMGPVEVLVGSLPGWDYEPDAPIFTPRISGCVLPGPKAALSLIKRGAGGEALRSFYEVPLEAGNGKLIATYDGVNRDPLTSFPGDPLDVSLDAADAAGLAESVYEALKPVSGGRDFRVAVACLLAGDFARNEYETAIINRHERT
jgi:IMP cyclohydrolase